MADGRVPSPVPAPAPPRLPFIVLLLAAGTFLMCTTEYLVAGVLPEMAGDFGVGLAQAGLLITAFAIGMIIGAPVIAVATVRLPRRATLVLALAVFAAGHVLAALSSDFAVILAARVLTALATGAFWSIAAVVATTAAGPALASRALGVMMSGVGLATVVGVPLGTWTGQHLGWRGAFWALAVLAAVTAPVIGRLTPTTTAVTATTSIGRQVSVLRSGRLWLLLAATVLVTGGYMTAFAYISPLITDGAGLPESAVPLVLVGFGIGALVGTNVAGRLADRRPLTTFIAAAVGAGLTQLLLVLSSNPTFTVALLVLLGVTGMAVPPVATGLAVELAAAAPALAAGLAVSAFNAGIALGSWIGGYALDSSLGPTGPALVGVIMTAIGLAPLLALATTGSTALVPTAEPDDLVTVTTR